MTKRTDLITDAELRKYSDPRVISAGLVRLAKSLDEKPPATVFISHAHADADLVEATRRFLASLGVTIYVDWEDPEMPSATSTTTASTIKDKIKRLGKVVVLASTKAQESKWVPWELGFADAAIGLTRIAVLGVADNQANWDGAEYLGLYPSISKGSDGNWGVFEAGSSRGVTLEAWLKR